MKVHDLVRLIIPHPNVEVGHLGTIVHCYEGGGYEVEFVIDDTTSEVLTLEACDIEPWKK